MMQPSKQPQRGYVEIISDEPSHKQPVPVAASGSRGDGPKYPNGPRRFRIRFKDKQVDNITHLLIEALKRIFYESIKIKRPDVYDNPRPDFKTKD